MNNEAIIKCPLCSNGKVRGHRDYRDAHGKRRGEWFASDCGLCQGTSLVNASKAAPFIRGEAIRDKRIESGINVRQEAVRLGLTPSELSRLENGRADGELWQRYETAYRAAKGCEA